MFKLRSLWEKIPTPGEVVDAPRKFAVRQIWKSLPMRQIVIYAVLAVLGIIVLTVTINAIVLKVLLEKRSQPSAQVEPELPPPEELREAVPPPGAIEGPRSGHWQTLRNEFVRAHPTCEVCGSDESLNVHHIHPFHEHPELELEWGNLVTLCRDHHFHVGHDPDGPWGPQKADWKASNPNVIQDAARMRRELLRH